ncbi:hypothetical protein C8J56DRAFT_1048031 [Mycena floridula]|nr:hypothetical protein C8J56DRAFT_1048031 [Mycena floridula]
MSSLLRISEMVREIALRLSPLDLSSFTRVSTHFYDSSIDPLFAEMYIATRLPHIADSTARAYRQIFGLFVSSIAFRLPDSDLCLRWLAAALNARSITLSGRLSSLTRPSWHRDLCCYTTSLDLRWPYPLHQLTSQEISGS